MSKELTAGESTTRRFTIDRTRTIGFMGDEARVYSTPMVVQAWVDVTITIKEVDGRAVHIEAAVKDPLEEVARARHSRFIVDIEKTRERLAAKKAKTPAG